jgi:hypothetical protein
MRGFSKHRRRIAKYQNTGETNPAPGVASAAGIERQNNLALKAPQG